jgi:S-DNA-T family DNA segregation ATPase FtsK/SpoIIIE
MARARKKTRTKKKSKEKNEVQPNPRTREIVGIVILAAALMLGAAQVSLHVGDGGLMGPFGRAAALGLYAVLGMAGYLVILAMGLMALKYLANASRKSDWRMWLGYLGATVAGSVILHCLFPSSRLSGFGAGGKVGESLGAVLLMLFSQAGTYLLAVVALILCLILATDISLVQASVAVGGFIKRTAATTRRTLSTAGSALRRTFSWKAEPVLATEAAAAGGAPAITPDSAPMVEPVITTDPLPAEPEPVPNASPQPAPAVEPEPPKAPQPPEPPSEPAGNGARRKGKAPALPKIVEPPKRDKRGKAAKKPAKQKPPRPTEYRLPEVELLEVAARESRQADRQTMFTMAQRLETTLKDYGIRGSVREIHPGPVVTMYEFVPARGTKLSKITALSSDLAMSMEATKVRIVAPIPGKAAVGIEIPNRTRETVHLRELLEDPSFFKGRQLLRMALGKDIVGQTVAFDLAKAPHLMIAGATGAGKSVGVHAMLISLLYQHTPDQLRVILVDPKMLEFAVYDDIPHLLHPVVTDPKKAKLALRWAVEEMERRYQKLADLGVRDLENYNRKVARLNNDAQDEPEEEEEDADEVEVELIEDSDEFMPEKECEGEIEHSELPHVVVIIDEFADLMMAAPKDVETCVARIAQKARAAGIHLIVATQRPSTDVITGLIKSNFPTRIAYQVSSKTDSRVILDQGGAETLLGAGDMLFSNRGLAPRRVHGPLVTTQDIEKVTEFLRAQGKPDYNMEIIAPQDEPEDEASKEPLDEKYDEAIAIEASERNPSISYLQRRLRVGYNRAARMIEQMERDGIVGPPDGVKGREILIPPGPQIP